MEFSGLNNQSQSFILLINVKMPTVVGILTFMSRINFMLSSVENKKSFITLGPAQLQQLARRHTNFSGIDECGEVQAGLKVIKLCLHTQLS